MLHTFCAPVIHRIHGRQHLQDPGKTATEHGGVIIAAHFIILALPRLQAAEGGTGVAERGEISICYEQFIYPAGHRIRNVADPHQEPLDQK